MTGLDEHRNEQPQVNKPVDEKYGLQLKIVIIIVIILSSLFIPLQTINLFMYATGAECHCGYEGVLTCDDKDDSHFNLDNRYCIIAYLFAITILATTLIIGLKKKILR